MVAVILVVLFLLLFLIGVSQLLQALWMLHEGTTRENFMTRGMLGACLMAASVVVPLVILFAINAFIH